jgi:hypothetical protein
MTEYWWIRLTESLLACHSIQFSRFRRSGALPYRSRAPLSMRSFRVFRSRYRVPLDPCLETKKRLRSFAEALGRPQGGHREMTPDLSVRLHELAVYQAGTPFPEGTRPKRPAYVTTGSHPAQGSFSVFVVCFDTHEPPEDKQQVIGVKAVSSLRAVVR